MSSFSIADLFSPRIMSSFVNLYLQDAGGWLGGRLGVYTHSQEKVTWSKMTTVCL